MDESQLRAIEAQLFCLAMRERYGYDFSQYAQASLRRRLDALTQSLGYSSVVEILPQLLRDERLLPRVLAQLSVPVTEMFRDPEFFLALRTDVLPMLDSFPRITIWQAGCATGEESYSLAILLAEAGLLHKTTLFATDINDEALARAEQGIYPARHLVDYAEAYRASGGTGRLEDYFNTAYELTRVVEPLRSKLVFAHHNLASDGVFSEVNMVLCRNVLIYFDRRLQNRVLRLFAESLIRGGYLGLGTRESLEFTEVVPLFSAQHPNLPLYRRRGGRA